jgi:hypothetical protein
MGEALRKVQPGQRLEISAAAYNTFVDVARDWLGDQLAGGADGLMGRRRLSGIMPIRNESGAARERYDILGINGVAWGPGDDLQAFKNRQVLKGIGPSWPAHRNGKIAVLLAPADVNQIAWACVSGVVPVKVEMRNENDLFADTKNSSPSGLESRNEGGAFILWREGGTGSQWALVLLGGPCDPVGGVFAIHVTIDGGFKGSPDANCTLTYTARDLFDSDPPLGTSMAPKRPRYPLTEYVEPSAASVGLGYYDQGAEFQLIEALEEIAKTDLPELISQVRYDSASHKFQLKKRKVRVIEMRDEDADWTDIVALSECNDLP